MTKPSDDFRERIAHFFSVERERAKLKQRTVADALGVTVTTLSRYENGKVPIPASAMRVMAALYGVDPDGWMDDRERAAGTALRIPPPPREVDRTAAFARSDIRYWAARWDQAVISLRHVLAEHEGLADEMREEAFGAYRFPQSGGVRVAEPGPTPPVTPERLEQRIADQIPPDASGTDDPVRAQG